MPDRIWDAIVVGAGLAGLAAARELAEAGHRTLVLEARDRVGGRVWSRAIPGCSVPVDLGAEWVSPQFHHAVMAELERHGLELDRHERHGPSYWTLDGSVLSAADLAAAPWRPQLEAAQARLAADASRIDFHATGTQADVDDLDLPFADYLDRLELPAPVRELLLAESFGLLGGDPAEYSALALLREIAGFGFSVQTAFEGEICRVVGGADSIARSMAAASPAAIEQDAPVDAVSEVSDGVLVRSGDRIEHARAVVLAVPVNVLDAIAFDPVPPVLAAASAALPQAGRIRKRWYRSTGVPTDMHCTGSGAMAGAYSMSSPEGVQLTATFCHADRLGDDEKELGAVFPDARLTECLTHDWVGDPWARGTWLSARPGQIGELSRLTQRPGRVRFAGGDVAAGWAGWMDGALTSGAEAGRAAANELDRA